MLITPVKTTRIVAGSLTLTELADTYLDHLDERSILAVTSKVVSLCEDRVVDPDTVTKADLVASECEQMVVSQAPHGIRFTITRGTLIPNAGIDESNVGGGYALWPADPQASANDLRRHLRQRFDLAYVGVVITDSTCTPLRSGTTGICLAHSGFRAVRDYVGQPDLFGRPMQVSRANLAGGLAAAAVLAMGEGTEQTPLCVIRDVPGIEFQTHDPTAEDLQQLRISLEQDLFAPFLTAVQWEAGEGS